MKYLRLVLGLTVIAFIANSTAVIADSYDSDQATIAKGGKDTAKVMIGTKSYMAPVTFADGADWSSVKDHYELDSDTAAGIKSGMMSMSVGSDGGVSFTKMKSRPEGKEASKPAVKAADKK